jgi:pimeloyl-ACP methyl ester carboxylesterase
VLSKVARLPTRTVRYLETGSGTPVVLLHAFPLNADQWLPQLHRAPQGWRVIAPDFRGFRGNDLGAAPDFVSIDTYAADIFELMAHLDIPSARVCGVSMGGYVAFAMLRRDARRVTSLVLADTRAAADSDEARAKRDRTLKLVRDEGGGGLAALMVPQLLGKSTLAEQPDLADAVTRLVRESSIEGLAAAILAMKQRPDSTPALASITCPTTVVCGDEDTITPVSEAEAMQRAIPGSRLVILPRAGHLSNLEAPRLFNDVLFTRYA